MSDYQQQAEEEMWDAIVENENRETRMPLAAGQPLVDRRAVRWMNTRYPGHCASCGGTIARGAMAEWHPNGKYLVCKRCAS